MRDGARIVGADQVLNDIGSRVRNSERLDMQKAINAVDSAMKEVQALMPKAIDIQDKKDLQAALQHLGQARTELVPY